MLNPNTLLMDIYHKPQASIQLLEDALKKIHNKKLLCNYHRLLSVAYALMNNHENELKQINIAESYCETTIDQLYINTRKAVYYFCQHKDLKALYILSSSLDAYKNLEIKDSDLHVQIKLNLTLVLRNIGDQLLQTLLLEEIKQELDEFNIPLLHANYYYVKALVEFDDELFIEAIDSFKIAQKEFEKLCLSDKSDEILIKLGIATYKAGKNEFSPYFEKFVTPYENNYTDSDFLKFLIEIGTYGVNPFLIKPFTDIQSIEVLKVFEGENDLFSLHLLSSYAKEYFTITNNMSLIGPYLDEIESLNKEYRKQLNAFKETKQVFEEQIMKLKAGKSLMEGSFKKDVSHTLNSIQSFLQTNIEGEKEMALVKSKKIDASQLLWKEFSSQIAINTNQGLQFLETNSITRMEAEGTYTAFIDINNKTYLTSKNIAYYEQRLDPNQFLRIHRSTIVNRKYIKKFTRGRVGIIELTNGVSLEVASRRMAEINAKLAGNLVVGL
jgi:hypothetical protein